MILTSGSNLAIQKTKWNKQRTSNKKEVNLKKDKNYSMNQGLSSKDSQLVTLKCFSSKLKGLLY